MTPLEECSQTKRQQTPTARVLIKESFAARFKILTEFWGNGQFFGKLDKNAGSVSNREAVSVSLKQRDGLESRLGRQTVFGLHDGPRPGRPPVFSPRNRAAGGQARLRTAG